MMLLVQYDVKKLPEVLKDDLIAICSTGAYSSCMASEYNLRPKASEIFVKKNKIIISNN